MAIILPFTVASIALGSESKTGILWKNLNAMGCNDDTKGSLFSQIQDIEEDLTSIDDIAEYAVKYISILEGHRIPNPQGYFIVFLLCLIREKKIILDDALIDIHIENIITFNMAMANKRAMIGAIAAILNGIYYQLSLSVISELAEQVYNMHSNENWQARDWDNRFEIAQTITNTFLRQLIEYKDFRVAGIAVHENLDIPDTFELVIKVLVAFYGAEIQLTNIQRKKYTYENGEQGVFPAINEISPFFIGNTPP